MKKAVKIKMLERDLRLSDLAECIGRTPNYVSRALNFKTDFTVSEAFKLGELLGAGAEEVKELFTL